MQPAAAANKKNRRGTPNDGHAHAQAHSATRKEWIWSRQTTFHNAVHSFHLYK